MREKLRAGHVSGRQVEGGRVAIFAFLLILGRGLNVLWLHWGKGDWGILRLWKSGGYTLARFGDSFGSMSLRLTDGEVGTFRQVTRRSLRERWEPLDVVVDPLVLALRDCNGVSGTGMSASA